MILRNLTKAISAEDIIQNVKYTEQFSDEQILKIENTLYRLADLALDSYFDSKKDNKLL